MSHNEPKNAVKNVILGQCTVCIKGLNQRFLKIFLSGASLKGSSEEYEKKH